MNKITTTILQWPSSIFTSEKFSTFTFSIDVMIVVKIQSHSYNYDLFSNLESDVVFIKAHYFARQYNNARTALASLWNRKMNANTKMLVVFDGNLFPTTWNQFVE
jgi:hypothetical protein